MEDDVRTLYLDCFSGISGDMLLGVLVDLGVAPEQLTAGLAKLHVDGYQMRYSRRAVSAIEVQDVDVVLEDPSAPHPHTHEHGHDHKHGRNLGDCTAIIAASGLSDWVKEHAIAVFTEVARAEATVHGTSVDQVHFHEVGAVDSIVDIVGAFIGLELLGRPRVVASAVHDGHGFVDMAHGRMPVPAPAVAEMLASAPRPIPYVQRDVDAELVTPTGIGILRTICERYGPMRATRIERVGYGAGKRDTGGLNALRGLLGVEIGSAAPEDAEDAGMAEGDLVAILQATVDDQTGEGLAYARQRLLDEGALDAYFTPVSGKKGRPAVVLTVIAKGPDRRRLADLILTETSTLGVRVSEERRYVLPRKVSTVRTPFGEVGVKSARLPDGGTKAAPEYEDCARLAREHGVPLAVVFDAAKTAFASGRSGQGPMLESDHAHPE